MEGCLKKDESLPWGLILLRLSSVPKSDTDKKDRDSENNACMCLNSHS